MILFLDNFRWTDLRSLSLLLLVVKVWRTRWWIACRIRAVQVIFNKIDALFFSIKLIFIFFTHFERQIISEVISGLVHIFWEGHKVLRNLYLTFVYSTYRQKQGGDLSKFYGLLRMYEIFIQSKVRGRFRKILWPS